MSHSHGAKKQKDTKPAVELSSDDVAALQKAYNLFDYEHNNKAIDGAELFVFLRGLDPDIEYKTVEEMLHEADEEGDGVLDFSSVLQLLRKNRRSFKNWEPAKLEARIRKAKSGDIMYDVMQKNFPGAMLADDFAATLRRALGSHGFEAKNTIAAVSICRDEICKPFMQSMVDNFGLCFELTTLAGMVFVGKVGMGAALHHSPQVKGREHYLVLACPHISVDAFGEIGSIWRAKRVKKSSACGALCAFLGEVSGSGKGKDKEINMDDLEYSLMKKKLLAHIPYETKTNLIEVTKTAAKVALQDIETLVKAKVDTKHADYAVVVGVQIHGPSWMNTRQELNFVWPSEMYAVVDGKKQSLTLTPMSPITTIKRGGLRFSEVETLRRAFNLFDLSPDKTIDGAEFAILLNALSPKIASSEIDRFLADADALPDGHINFESLIQMIDHYKSTLKAFQLDQIEDRIRQVKNGEVFRQSLLREFPGALVDVEFAATLNNALNGIGFTAENTIALISLCRDEICFPVMDLLNRNWGLAFGLTSLAGMVFVGGTGFSAGLHHSPRVGGRERYLIIACPHIAIDAMGEIGSIWRPGRLKKSNACGALCAFLGEVTKGDTQTNGKSRGGVTSSDVDWTDMEYSLMKQKLFELVPPGSKTNLVEVTKAAMKQAQKDVEKLIAARIKADHADYAVVMGVQIHGPSWINGKQELNYLWPGEVYAVINGKKKSVDFQGARYAQSPSSTTSPIVGRSIVLTTPGGRSSDPFGEGDISVMSDRRLMSPEADPLEELAKKMAAAGVDEKKEKKGKEKEKEETPSKPPSAQLDRVTSQKIEAFNFGRQLKRAMSTTNAGEETHLNYKADLNSWIDTFQNFQMITRSFRALDPSAPDHGQKFLGRLQQARRTYDLFQVARIDLQRRQQRLSATRAKGGDVKEIKAQVKEAKEIYEKAEKKLVSLMSSLESEKEVAHEAAIDDVVGILRRIKPKWRRKAKPKSEPKLKREEYFYTTVAAIKKQYKSLANGLSDDELWAKALKADVPFEWFHDWILANLRKAELDKDRDTARRDGRSQTQVGSEKDREKAIGRGSKYS